jgi:hypothetical protein
VTVKVDMLPSGRRDCLGKDECFGVFARLVFVEQPQKDGGGCKELLGYWLFCVIFGALQEVIREAVGIHVLLPRLLFGDGILRRLFRRASPAKPTSALLRF